MNEDMGVTSATGMREPLSAYPPCASSVRGVEIGENLVKNIIVDHAPLEKVRICGDWLVHRRELRLLFCH